jgi:type II secretory pathway pseudopilin PulG
MTDGALNGRLPEAPRRTKAPAPAESIVIVVIATLLSALVLFTLGSYAAKAKNVGAEAEGRMVLTALQVYASERGLTSTTFDDAAELEPIVTAVSELIAHPVNVPGGAAETQIIASVSLNHESKVVDFVYISSAGKTVAYDGSSFTVQ